VAAASGLTRRESSEEPFFGEIGRFRDLRYLALVDTRRDALANPARVARLLQGEGFSVAEVANSRRQGRVEPYRKGDFSGVVHGGTSDLSEALDSADLFHYQALDDGRWAGALRLQRVNLRATDRFLPSSPAGPLVGGEVRREGALEGPGFSAQVQRSWNRGAKLWGVGFLQQVEDLRGMEAYAAAPGAPIGRELVSSEVLDRRQVASLGYSWDRSSGEDLGLVLRFQEREVDRSGRSRLRDGVPGGVGNSLLLDQYNVSLDALWRRRLSDRQTLGARIFFESSRAQRFQAVNFDLTRAREEDEIAEGTHLYGVALGLLRQPRRDTLLSLDLGWQRLDRSGDVVRFGGPVLVLDDRETRTSLHLGVNRTWSHWDARGSLQLLRVHQDEHYLPVPGAGLAPPLTDRDSQWRTRMGITFGRWLSSTRRFELELEEREQESPERLLRLRLVRSF
jgi:hypothetical protein